MKLFGSICLFGTVFIIIILVLHCNCTFLLTMIIMFLPMFKLIIHVAVVYNFKSQALRVLSCMYTWMCLQPHTFSRCACPESHMLHVDGGVRVLSLLRNTYKNAVRHILYSVGCL